MPKITAAIMTLNEERSIERCISSLKGIADEILIVDSFSTDKTEEICIHLGARFIQHPFEGYIEQRQYCIDSATHDHVLVIDADEELSEELRNQLLGVKENWTHDGYEFNRLNSICGHWIRHSGWYPDRKLRLIDRQKAIVKGNNPHDVIKMGPGASKKHLKGDLLHYTYDTVDDQVNQINRFTSIQAIGNFESGKKTNWAAIFISPVYKFIRHYIFRLGFLDGYFGFLICQNMAYSTFLKHFKLMVLWKMEKRKRNGTAI